DRAQQVGLSLGAGSDDYASAQAERAAVLTLLRRYDEAKRAVDEAVAIRERLHGSKSPVLIENRWTLAAMRPFQRRPQDAGGVHAAGGGAGAAGPVDWGRGAAGDHARELRFGGDVPRESGGSGSGGQGGARDSGASAETREPFAGSCADADEDHHESAERGV